MASLAEVNAEARRLYLSGKAHPALRLWDAVVAAVPHSIAARTRVADCLATLGEPEAAVRVYREVARYALKAGHPLAAIVIAKVLESMEADFDDLLATLVAFYGSESELLGKMGGRIPTPAGDTEVQPPHPQAPVDTDLLANAAERAATCLDDFDDFPEALHRIPLLSDLSESALRRVLSTLIVGRLPGDAVVIRQGEPGSSFFFVASGEVLVSAKVDGRETELARLHEGSIFGEMALLSSQPRSASVSVVGEADLIEVTRESLTVLAGELEQVATALHRFTRERLLNNLMATSPLFRPFNKLQRRDLLRRFTSYDVDANTDIIREGEAGRGLFVIVSGEVAVTKQGASGPLPLATLRPGDILGEMALIRGDAATATVTASLPTTVLFLARETVDRIVAGVPEIREYLEAVTEDRELDTQLALSDADLEEDVIIMI